MSRGRRRAATPVRRILYAVDVLDAYMPCENRPANDNAACRAGWPAQRRPAFPALRVVARRDQEGTPRRAP
ncbi:hypothetical protein M446_4206 [Methylobacterium sp. 4-46]|uniref:hypothetical protein n=1 Tax=unclassified Methylobacterium TaxID=2615210 RepID=UPI000165C9E7|nr:MULTISPECIES: hypothetical protein [Methylobacterium]ACA18555.1 hypothetical protein M446_4206 [Methylobacterium sp. 4-46]WFT77840.1 hypothetical protein QA634_21335 [Methylobacterium nodulans]